MKIPAKFEKWLGEKALTDAEFGQMLQCLIGAHKILEQVAYRAYKQGRKSKQEEIYSAIRRRDIERVVHRVVLGGKR